MANTSASYVPENAIREIRDTCSIVGVISEYVSLKKVGTNYKGLCPFHNEKTPSFSVNDEKKFFHCFGCGTSGDVFAFLMKHDRLSFNEAVRLLAKRIGLQLPEKPLTAQQRRQQSEREALLAINEQAAQFYGSLINASEGDQARGYLHGRGISDETIAAFGIGFAPDGWDRLVGYLQSHDVPLEQAHTAGLIVSKAPGKYYDRFRNRIIFPIKTVTGHIIGFGGRVIDSGEPKYLNSPESVVYSKRHNLYGLNAAAKHFSREGRAIVVEGYLDVIALHQAGIGTAVAALGTSLTEHQIRLLKRYTSDIVTVFDADPSGQKAMVRSLEPFVRNGIAARLALLPQGEDPDSYVRQQGPEAFRQAVQSAGLLLDFVIEQTIQKYRDGTPQGTVKACDGVVALLKMLPDALERELYIQNVARRLGISESHIHGRLGGEAQPPVQTPAGRVYQPTPDEGGKDGAEKLIVKLMLASPAVIEIVAREALLEEFQDPDLQRLGRLVLDTHRSTGTAHPADVTAAAESAKERQLIAELAFQDDIPDDPYKGLEDCIRDMRLRKNVRQLKKISALLKQADAARDETLTRKYQQEHQSLIKAQKGIKQYKLHVQHI